MNYDALMCTPGVHRYQSRRPDLPMLYAMGTRRGWMAKVG